MATPTRTKKRQVVDFDPEVDSAADVAAAFDRLSVSAYPAVGRPSLCRHKEVVSALDDAISEMQSVAMKLKALAGDEIVDEPFSGKDISVNFAMWSVYELAQSLEESSYRFEMVKAGPSSPLSEYFMATILTMMPVGH